MLNEFGGLTQQMLGKPYRNMLFSVYNKAEEDRYTHNIKRLGYDNDFDSLEFIVLDPVKKVSLKEFKHYIENEVQHEEPIVGVLLLKGNGDTVGIVIKPKEFDINTLEAMAD